MGRISAKRKALSELNQQKRLKRYRKSEEVREDDPPQGQCTAPSTSSRAPPPPLSPPPTTPHISAASFRHTLLEK